MTLQQTVSKILGKKVTAKHAQLYANQSWGELRAYIKAEVVADILESRKKNKETVKYKVFNYKDKSYHESTKNRGKKSQQRESNIRKSEKTL